MSEVFNDYEQGQRVQQWIKENGPAIVMGIALALAALYGWRFWNNHLDNRKMAAAAEYRTLTQQLSSGNLDAAVESFELLKADHSATAYVGLAALHMAKARLDGSQNELALADLRLAADQGQPEAVQIIAKERLARVLLDMGQADEALLIVEQVRGADGFKARLSEVEGDILLIKGDKDGARNAYQLALEGIDSGRIDASLLQLKLDSLVETETAAQLIIPVENKPDSQAIENNPAETTVVEGGA